MIDFKGTYFDGKSSRAYPVNITFSDGFLKIQGESGQPSLNVPIRGCNIEPPLGETARTIKLPYGAQCDSNDLEAIRALERLTGRNNVMRFIHFLESRWKMVLASIAGLILCIWAFTVYGIPVLAEKAANALPVEVTNEVSRQTMKMFDLRFLNPTELDQDRIAELQELFADVHTDLDTTFNYRLELRKSPAIGPNAFALPTGLIVMTDEMVEIADNNRELEGIFIHEIAHVTNRHGLRSIIQNAGVFLLISALLGDVTSITSAAASLPTILLNSDYSRDFEREADRAVAIYFFDKGWNMKPYQDILQRITDKRSDYPGESLWSSHPVTSERIEYLKEFEDSMINE
ncbi:MAG TPA: M48 family metallopeptidase [Nitrospirae bacterium]|nr:M48 family metallopeptidase [Nitrospirota bacterium]